MGIRSLRIARRSRRTHRAPPQGRRPDFFPQGRRHWGMCGVAPDGGYRVGATNPTWRRQRVRGPPVRHQHHAGHDREANAGMMMCGAVCKPIFIASHQSQRSRRPVACRYAVTTLEAWTEIVGLDDTRRKMTRSSSRAHTTVSSMPSEFTEPPTNAILSKRGKQAARLWELLRYE